MSDLLEKLTARTWPWMAGAFVVVALFMLWLYIASNRVEEGGGDGSGAGAADYVADTTFAANPELFARQRIVVRPVTVEANLGRAALTLALPGRPGYPAILDRTVIDEELRLVAGDNLTLAGWVFALNDSILDVWAQRGLYESENRGQLVGSETFLLVDSLDFVFPGQEDAGGGS